MREAGIFNKKKRKINFRTLLWTRNLDFGKTYGSNYIIHKFLEAGNISNYNLNCINIKTKYICVDRQLKNHNNHSNSLLRCVSGLASALYQFSDGTILTILVEKTVSKKSSYETSLRRIFL